MEHQRERDELVEKYEEMKDQMLKEHKEEVDELKNELASLRE